MIPEPDQLQDPGGRPAVCIRKCQRRLRHAPCGAGIAQKPLRRARESLQLDIYALAQLKTQGRLPDKVELRFLESDLVASRRPTEADALATETRIRAAATAIRKRAFEARPTFFACSQCPFREICPHTAWGEPAGEPRE